MKLLTITILVFVFSFLSVSSQENLHTAKPKGRLLLNYISFGTNEIIPEKDIIGTLTPSGAGFYTLGIGYASPLKRWLELEFGIEYSRHQLNVSKWNWDESYPVSMPDERSTLGIVSLPVSLRAIVKKLTYFNAGMMMSGGDYSGLGFLAGFGVNYEFANRLSLNAGYHAKLYSVFSFFGDKETLYEEGLKLSVGYRF